MLRQILKAEVAFRNEAGYWHMLEHGQKAKLMKICDIVTENNLWKQSDRWH